MLAWWYITIGGAFILLGLRSVLRADSAWPIAFRFLIAVGFIVLGVGTLRTPSRKVMFTVCSPTGAKNATTDRVAYQEETP